VSSLRFGSGGPVWGPSLAACNSVCVGGGPLSSPARPLEVGKRTKKQTTPIISGGMKALRFRHSSRTSDIERTIACLYILASAFLNAFLGRWILFGECTKRYTPPIYIYIYIYIYFAHSEEHGADPRDRPSSNHGALPEVFESRCLSRGLHTFPYKPTLNIEHVIVLNWGWGTTNNISSEMSLVVSHLHF
jgi:hypothetical protein